MSADDHYIYKVKRAWVFGSYLSKTEKLGDVDLAIELAPKAFPGRSFDEVVQAKIAHACQIGFRRVGLVTNEVRKFGFLVFSSLCGSWIEALGDSLVQSNSAT